MISGYQIVSLKNINIIPNGDTIIISGIHKKIEGSHRKAIMLSDIVIDGVERNSRYTEFVVLDGAYVGYLAISGDVNVKITIDADDNVKIENE